jgi:hypothetical protein
VRLRGAWVAADPARNGLWWGMRPDMSAPLDASAAATEDARCQAFSKLIHRAGRGGMQHEQEGNWDSADGLYATMLLCDQLARNVFRGTPEAFAYDARAASIAKRLFDSGVSSDSHRASPAAAWAVRTCSVSSRTSVPPSSAVWAVVMALTGGGWAGACRVRPGPSMGVSNDTGAAQ